MPNLPSPVLEALNQMDMDAIETKFVSLPISHDTLPIGSLLTLNASTTSNGAWPATPFIVPIGGGVYLNFTSSCQVLGPAYRLSLFIGIAITIDAWGVRAMLDSSCDPCTSSPTSKILDVFRITY